MTTPHPAPAVQAEQLPVNSLPALGDNVSFLYKAPGGWSRTRVIGRIEMVSQKFGTFDVQQDLAGKPILSRCDVRGVQGRIQIISRHE